MAGPLQLPADPRAARTARAHVRTTLSAMSLLALCDTTLLLVTELVTNAVLHAGSASTLLIERAGTGIRVTVSDGSPVLPAQRRPSSTATTGRGCQLLSDLADDWGAQAHDGGKQVWFTLTGDRDPWAAFGADALLDSGEL